MFSKFNNEKKSNIKERVMKERGVIFLIVKLHIPWKFSWKFFSSKKSAYFLEDIKNNLKNIWYKYWLQIEAFFYKVAFVSSPDEKPEKPNHFLRWVCGYHLCFRLWPLTECRMTLNIGRGKIFNRLIIIMICTFTTKIGHKNFLCG